MDDFLAKMAECSIFCHFPFGRASAALFAKDGVCHNAMAKTATVINIGSLFFYHHTIGVKCKNDFASGIIFSRPVHRGIVLIM